MTEPLYNAPDIKPRDFLLAVLHDPDVSDVDRQLASLHLQEYDRIHQLYRPFRWPQRRPLNYVSKPKRSPVHALKSKAPAPITRWEWKHYLKAGRSNIHRLRAQVLINNEVGTTESTVSKSEPPLASVPDK